MSATGPDLSVVVPSVNGWRDLEGCLRALAAQDSDRPVEVLVADRVGDAVRGPLRAHFPAVRLLEAPPGSSIPALRAMAFEAASGAVVGVIEDHVLVPPDWARRMLAEHAGGARVVGGAVRNAATERLVDRAAFLCEYHRSLSPPAGPAEQLPGNNVTYQSAALRAQRAAWTADRWEDYLHDALRAAGVSLLSRPEIAVGHRMHYTVRSYLEQRFLYSRAWAGMRLRGAGAGRRLLAGLAALALPPVLLGRIVSAVWPLREHRADLVRSLPLLALFTSAWAAGEAVGAWAGGGDALARIR